MPPYRPTVTTTPADRPRASVFIATSVDGFIARPDDGLDWLTGQPDDELTGEHDPAQDFGYGEFFAGVDALVMGRGTFDVVQGFVGDWPYGDKPVYVWTSHPDDIEPPAGPVPSCVPSRAPSTRSSPAWWPTASATSTSTAAR